MLFFASLIFWCKPLERKLLQVLGASAGILHADRPQTKKGADMKRCPPLWYRAAFAALLVSLLAVGAYAQIQSGNIFGNVVGSDGAALPGVTVTLSGVGAPQTTVTDAEGRFRFINLSPGSYTLKAELAGFGTATRSGVGVSIGRNADVTITLNAAVSQTITVTAEAPMLDVRKTGTGATITKVELETVPSGRDPWVMLQQTPGVLMDRINVGGNESGQQSNYVSKGVVADQTSWNVDGVNITDVGALGSSPTYYDFDSFEEMQITTGGTDVRIQTPGAQINMVTKRGTNDLSGSARYLLTSGDYQADPDIPEEANDGTSVPSAHNYLAKVNEIDNIDDYGIEAGGPIIRDRLWVWGAYSKQQIDLFVAQPVGQLVRFTDKTELETYNGKLNAQLAPPNSLSVALMRGNKVKLGRNVGPTRPPETAWNQDSNYSGPTMLKIEDTHVFNSKFFLTGLYSKVEGGFQLISDNGQGCNDIECGFSGDPAFLYLGTTPSLNPGGWQNSYYNYYTERPQDQARLDGSTFFNTGSLSHELKFGFGYRDADVLSQSGWPGGQYNVFFGAPYGDPGEVDALFGTYLFRNTNFTYNVKSQDLYVGDTMMLGNLTIQAGLRWDKQEGAVQGGVIEANPTIPSILPSITYNSVDAGEFTSVSPRIGLTYALGAERKTLLRAAANRYHDQLGGFTVYGVAPGGYQYLYYYAVDANGNAKADPGEVDTSFLAGFYGLDPAKSTQPVNVRRWDPDLEVPHTDEFLIGAEHELFADFVLGATYTYRKLDDFVELRAEKTQGAGDFYTSADYVQNATNLTCNPATQNCGPFTSGYSLPFYRLKSGVPTPTYFVFVNAPDYDQEYSGLEITATKRMANRWMLRGSLTLQDWTQNVGSGYVVDPTRQRGGTGCTICDGSSVLEGSGSGSGAKGGIYISSDWAYNLTGAYQIPVIETTLGFNVTGRQGYPVPYVHRTGYIASEQTFKYVLIPDEPTEFRHEDIMSIDLRLAKEFRFSGVGLTASIDLFNVTNEQPILQRNTRLGVAAGNRITEIQSPRVFRLGARLTF